MSDSLIEIYALLLMLFFAMIVSGGLTYIAWFKPHEYREMLEQYSNLFQERFSHSAMYWKSSCNFWILRFTFLIGFLSVIVMTILLLLGYIPKV